MMAVSFIMSSIVTLVDLYAECLTTFSWPTLGKDCKARSDNHFFHDV